MAALLRHSDIMQHSVSHPQAKQRIYNEVTSATMFENAFKHF